MPIRLTTAYAERLAADRFEKGAQPRQDIVLLCHFWKKLREADGGDASTIRSRILSLVQEARSASGRLLDSDQLLECVALKSHEKFELALLAATIGPCVEAFEVIIEKLGKDLEATKAEDQKAMLEREKAIREKIETIANTQIGYLIGASPASFVSPFIREACSLSLAILATKGLATRASEIGSKYAEAAEKCFEVWLASSSKTSKWVSDYLNFQHQIAWTKRVSDDVKSIQQALGHWLQPTTEAEKRRVAAWDRYRQLLVDLPDSKETMFAEQFGVRKVFVQPIAKYKVAGIGIEAGTIVPDVANLIAGLISERVPGDELILLCGGPGSGKSTLCRAIASELASNKQMHPVFLRLRRLQDTQEIANFIETHLQKEGIIDKFSDLAEVSNLVLILDGFDELVMATRNRLREFFNTLREDLNSGPLRNAKAIVSGRDTLFPNGAGLPTGSHVISLLPFDKSRITVWGQKWRSLHSAAPGKNFQPEVFYDDQAVQPGIKTRPLHHLVSWPLTLHLVARVHSAGALDLTKAKQETVEKAVLYKSIVSEAALRQQNQSAGRGRLTPEQMREFVQAVSWEMYSTSRDALEHTEGLPLLKTIYPSASEAELADLADVAIVNQPELTKGEEGGFEFVHKSFSEYFVAEKFARKIEEVSFKAQNYDSKVTWRMSVKEALSELSSLIAMRVITAEVQEMLEPMLSDFKEFLRPAKSSKSRNNERVENLKTKKARVEGLVQEYASGKYQVDVVERVRGSKIIDNERDIHANFTLGLLILGCALTKRMVSLRPEKERDQIVDALFVSDSHLWKLISIIQAGETQIDAALADRFLSPIRIGSGKEKHEVLYPPIPTRLLHGVRDAVFPVEGAVVTTIDLASALIIENVISSFLRSPRKSPNQDDERQRYFRHAGVGRLGRVLSEAFEQFYRAGIVPSGSERSFARRDFRYLERNLEELVYRIRRTADEREFNFGREEFEHLRQILGEYAYEIHGGHGRYILGDVLERVEYMLRRVADR